MSDEGSTRSTRQWKHDDPLAVAYAVGELFLVLNDIQRSILALSIAMEANATNDAERRAIEDARVALKEADSRLSAAGDYFFGQGGNL